MEETRLLSFIFSTIKILRLRKKGMKREKTRWSREWASKKKPVFPRLVTKRTERRTRWLAQLFANGHLSLLSIARVGNTIHIEIRHLMRKAITPHERLTATLRYLTTGRSVKDLEFTIIISKPALSQIIPETCNAIYLVLKHNYLKTFIQFNKFPEKIVGALPQIWHY